jgi:hypothetical protein
MLQAGLPVFCAQDAKGGEKGQVPVLKTGSRHSYKYKKAGTILYRL